MDRGMQTEGRAFDGSLPLHHIAAEGTKQQAGSCQLRPEMAFRVHQEEIVTARRHEAEMIAGSGLIAEPRRPAQHGSKVDACLGKVVGDHANFFSKLSAAKTAAWWRKGSDAARRQQRRAIVRYAGGLACRTKAD